jgi:ribosomal protein S18 acetylase RimI-like enzyme
MIEIRLAQASDAHELKKLNDIFNEGEGNSAEGIEASLRTNTQEIVCVAADENKLAGFCCGQIQVSMCYTYEYAVITEFFVLDEYRRQGIGKRLFMAAEAEFNKRGVIHFHISTGDDNTAALALYRSERIVFSEPILSEAQLTITSWIPRSANFSNARRRIAFA